MFTGFAPLVVWCTAACVGLGDCSFVVGFDLLLLWRDFGLVVCCFVRLLGVGLTTVGLVVGLCFVGGWWFWSWCWCFCISFLDGLRCFGMLSLLPWALFGWLVFPFFCGVLWFVS